MGCSYIGFVRGDGLGYAVQSGIRAADSMVRYVENADFGRINPEQVSELKEKIYAPLNRTSNHHADEIFQRIEEYAFHIDVMLAKSEKRINRVLKEIGQMWELVPQLSATDAHTLAKCHEAQIVCSVWNLFSGRL